ncbi:MAG: hypothetical protein M3Z75_09620 [Actinomycetota bacterium]|nr:hypothetical protein [Actinomycetota bacterium]
MLAAGIAAVTAGSRSFAAIGQWAADAGSEALAVLARHADRRRSPHSAARSPWSAPISSTGSWVPGCTPGPCRLAGGYQLLIDEVTSAAECSQGIEALITADISPTPPLR